MSSSSECEDWIVQLREKLIESATQKTGEEEEEQEQMDSIDGVLMKGFQELFVEKGYGREMIGLKDGFVPKRYSVEIRPRSRDFCIVQKEEEEKKKVETETEEEEKEIVVVDEYQFDGEVTIHAEITRRTRLITLNVNEIIVKNCKVIVTQEDVENEIIPIRTIMNPKVQTVVFVLDKCLPVSANVRVVVQYEGTINDKMVGLYRSRYSVEKEVEGEEQATKIDKFMAITQFESVGARMAFPCIDEPAVKAQFELSLVIPTGFVGLSNMPAVGEPELLDDAKLQRIRFAPSVVMSTYLYAICIVDATDYQCVEGIIPRIGEDEQEEPEKEKGILVRVWSRRPAECQFALECTLKALPLYEEYFEEGFPLPKCDLIAVSEFSAGAMENWGLITFRETAVLLNPDTSAASTRQRVAIVVIHELAHQWFGNLVTMEWWVDLWLNEGFATWCEYFICDKIFPEMQIWRSFITDSYVSALGLDSLESSHPIEVHVTKAEQIDEIFDTISYEKGCCVIRMAVEFLGIDVFRRGVCSYLKQFKYGNATTNDLWDHLAKISGEDVRGLMSFWTRTVGYPYVIVKKGEEGTNTLALEQRRFLISGKNDENGSVWPIPLSFISNVNSEPTKILMNEKTLTIQLPDGVEWVKFNPGCKGFYRVLYDDPELIASLQKNIESLPELDRFSLMTDVTAMVRSGLMESSTALAFIGSLRNEETFVVIDGMVSTLGTLRSLVKYDPDPLKLFCQYARGVLEKMKGELGKWESCETDHIRIKLQKLVVSALVTWQDPDMIAQARAAFAEDVNLPTVVADLRDVALRIVVKEGGRTAYDKVLHLFENSESDEIKIRCLRALGRSKEPELQQQALEYMYTDSVKNQDKIYLFASVAYNPKAREVMWSDFVANWGKIEAMYSGSMLLKYFIQCACGIWDTNEKAEMVIQFFQDHPCPAASMTIQQCVEAVRTRGEFVAREKDKLIQWLSENVKIEDEEED